MSVKRWYSRVFFLNVWGKTQVHLKLRFKAKLSQFSTKLRFMSQFFEVFSQASCKKIRFYSRKLQILWFLIKLRYEKCPNSGLILAKLRFKTHETQGFVSLTEMGWDKKAFKKNPWYYLCSIWRFAADDFVIKWIAII